MNKKPLDKWSDEEKISTVKNMFSEITPHYDLLNHLLSCYQDVRWRKFVVRKLPENPEKIIDIATGTGDLAIEIAEKHASAKIIGVDFVKEMLNLAHSKTEQKGLNNRIEYVEADALNLPFDDNSFDAATIAFGLRNIPDRIGALREMKRVVRNGGKVLVLEMTFPENLGLRKFFEIYFKHWIPFMGSMISGNKNAYEYLPLSIQEFPKPQELTELFKRAGLTNVETHRLTFGITYLHEGIVN